MPAYGSYHHGSYDVKFDILEGNVENAFDIIKRVENGMYVGKYRDFALWLVFYQIWMSQPTANIDTWILYLPAVSMTGNCIFFLIKKVVF